MIFSTPRLFPLLALVVCSLCASAFAEPEAPATSQPRPELLRIRVDDTSTRVMIAKVNLSVSDLYVEDGMLKGTYDIDVPMASSKSEGGSIALPMSHDFLSYMREGGVLKGEGVSFKLPEAQRLITCTVIPDPKDVLTGTIVLEIDTGSRVMDFKSTYQLVEIPEPVGSTAVDDRSEREPRS